jgi:hypothetical protein
MGRIVRTNAYRQSFYRKQVEWPLCGDRRHKGFYTISLYVEFLFVGIFNFPCHGRNITSKECHVNGFLHR